MPFVRRLALVAVIATTATRVAAQGPAPRVVVHDSVGTPVPFAVIQSGGSVVVPASDSGIALLRVPRADSLKLLVRRIGFEPVERWVRPDADGDYHVVLRPLPQNVNRVTIYARETPLSRAGFYDRMTRVDRGAISARFLTPEAVELRNAAKISQLLEGESFVRVRTMHQKTVLTGRGGNCPMGLLVDGQLMTGTTEDILTRLGQRELDRVMSLRPGMRREEAEYLFMQDRRSIDEIVTSLAVHAIEIYASMATVPVELARSAPREACGLVVVWTGRR
jgi:hypothetical protein